MPRKGPAPKRPIDVDPVYGSQLVTQLVNKVLLDGKKQVAERIVYGALEGCRAKTGTDPVVTLKRALDNVKPAIEVKSRRVGGATYQVPIEVKGPPAPRCRCAGSSATPDSVARRPCTSACMNEILDASQRPRCRGEEASRGHPQDGRVQPGLRPLPLVTSRSGPRPPPSPASRHRQSPKPKNADSSGTRHH